MTTESSSDGFARAVQGETGTLDRLDLGVQLAAELVDGCDDAGVTIASSGLLETPAATGEIPRRGDALQYELDEGPCLDSVRGQHTVISPDLAVENRWERWAPRMVTELGVNAMMSVLLYTDRNTLGALNLYAKRPDAWTDHSISVALALADQLAVAVADARQMEHQDRAIIARNTIGQAQGILMERFDITADQAFAYLRRISSTTNRKLSFVAQDIATNRQVPHGAPPPDDNHA